MPEALVFKQYHLEVLRPRHSCVQTIPPWGVALENRVRVAALLNRGHGAHREEQLQTSRTALNDAHPPLKA